MAGAGVEHKKEKASSFKKLLSAFFSEIAQGVEREDSIGLDAGGAGSVAKRWRRPRSEPEYTERRSDAVQAAEKCAKYRGSTSIIQRTIPLTFNARRSGRHALSVRCSAAREADSSRNCARWRRLISTIFMGTGSWRVTATASGCRSSAAAARLRKSSAASRVCASARSNA